MNNVVKRIAKHVWSDGYPRRFIIKGSYPASMYAYEHSNLELPFNDIDVLIDIPESSDKCKDETYSKYESQFGFSRFIDSTFVDDLLPGSNKQVQVVRLCDIEHPEDLITKYSDINAISAGFIVTPDDDSSGEPMIEKWVTSPRYEDFLQTKTLEVMTRHKPTHESTIVRLLDKAQRLNMEYVVPEWLDSLHGDVMLPMYKRLLDTLDDQYKDVVYSRFDLMPIHDNKLYMFVGKGKDDPEVPTIDDSPLFRYSSQSGSDCTSNCSQNGGSSSSLDNCTEQCNCNGVEICIMPKCTKNCNSNGGRKAEMPMCEYNCNCHSKICKMAGRNDLAAIA